MRKMLIAPCLTVVLFTTGLSGSEKRGVFFNAYVATPYILDSMESIFGAGLEFDLNKRLSLSTSFVSRSYEYEESWRHSRGDFYGLFNDLKYRISRRKKISLHLIASEGILYRKTFETIDLLPYKLKERVEYEQFIFFGIGIGLNYHLNSRWRMFFELRLYAASYKSDDKIYVTGCYPVVVGISYRL